MSGIALITGAARGIGLSISKKLKEDGFKIVGFDLGEPEENIFDGFYKVDVTDMESIKKAYEEMKKDGLTPVKVLVNNAGITKDGLFLRMKEEDFKKVIDINLNGVFNVTKVFFKDILSSKGVVINMASVVGLYGNIGQANYAASKAGVIGFTYSIAKELAMKKARAVAIAPGFIKTPMTDKIPEKMREEIINRIPMREFGLPEDVANLVSFLASDKSKYITGCVIPIAGGLRI